MFRNDRTPRILRRNAPYQNKKKIQSWIEVDTEKNNKRSYFHYRP